LIRLACAGLTYVLSLSVCTGNYTVFETAREDKKAQMSRLQENLDRQREHIHDSIAKMTARAKGTKKGADDKRLNQVASRRMKLDRMGLEKMPDGALSALGSLMQPPAPHLDVRVCSVLQASDSTCRPTLTASVPPTRTPAAGRTASTRLSCCHRLPSLLIRPCLRSCPPARRRTGGRVDETPDKEIKFDFASAAAEPLGTMGPVVQFKKASFTYKEAKAPTLRDIVLDIDMKSRVTVLGKNGAGQSACFPPLLTAPCLPTVFLSLLRGMPSQASRPSSIC
jgi:ATPase subunit of ABC transporter with duplicated ATPase domains